MHSVLIVMFSHISGGSMLKLLVDNCYLSMIDPWYLHLLNRKPLYDYADYGQTGSETA